MERNAPRNENGSPASDLDLARVSLEASRAVRRALRTEEERNMAAAGWTDDELAAFALENYGEFSTNGSIRRRQYDAARIPGLLVVAWSDLTEGEQAEALEEATAIGRREGMSTASGIRPMPGYEEYDHTILIDDYPEFVISDWEIHTVDESYWDDNVHSDPRVPRYVQAYNEVVKP